METIAFDLDGTLIDIEKRDYTIYNDALSELGYKAIQESTYWKLRRSRHNIFKILEMSGLTSETDSSLFLRSRNDKMERKEYLMMDSLFSDVLYVLKILSDKYELSLVTKRDSLDNTKWQLSRLGLEQFFPKVYVTQDKAEAYSRLADLKIIVGDTENDIYAAKLLDIKSIAVSTGIRNNEFLHSLKPDYVVLNLHDILNIII